VFIELKRRGKDVYYWKNSKGEVDFVIKEGLQPTALIQVCWDVTDTKTKKREMNSLLEAMQLFKLKQGIVITEDYSGTEKVDEKIVTFIPLWKWLLSE
jgi:predicted AAA+ superfamily ATPase